ncbi:glycosyltransferase family 4 protein [Lacibacter sp. H375]|uniref:glycosyltransferase family 4 protein n=1 Tax=Lacibacter sp. H375 TaxID=3133424 RepID=UPI0030C39B55
MENISDNPGAGHYKGIQNSDLIERIDFYKPDALLVFGWSFQSHLQILRHYKGKTQILFRGDSTLLDEKPGFSIKKVMRRLFLRWVYKHVDIALFTGTANKAYYLQHGLKEHQLRYAPHAVDNDRFYDVNGLYEEQGNKWRQELGISCDEVVFLFAGKFEPKKDPVTLLEAFLSVNAKNTRLVLVGNGVLEPVLKTLAASSERVIFLDFQNQQLMPVVYRLANVFVLPSKGPGETWGLSVNEAMACGLPVMVSNRCGCADDLVYENGFIIKAGKKEEIAQIIRELSVNSQILEQMSSESLKRIIKFTFVSIAEAIEIAVSLKKSQVFKYNNNESIEA